MGASLSPDLELVEEELKANDELIRSADVSLALKDFVAWRWAEENRESIAAFNKEIEERGVWSENLRSW